MLGTEETDHVLVVGDRCGDEAIALAGLDHHIVVVLEGPGRCLGLISADRRALAQSLPHIATATRLHAGEDRVVSARDIDDHGMVIRHGRESRVRVCNLVRHGHADEDLLAIMLVEIVGKRLRELILLFLCRLMEPDGPMNGIEVAVAMGLVFQERAHRHIGSVHTRRKRAPGRASGNRCLILRPDSGLLDWEQDVLALDFLFEAVERDLADIHRVGGLPVSAFFLSTPF